MSSDGLGFVAVWIFAGLMLRLLRYSSRVQDWSARSRSLARTFVVEPRRLLEIDRNGPVSSVLCVGKLSVPVPFALF